MSKLALTGTWALLACLSLSRPAEARVEAGSSYTKSQTFSCALRFLRVDRGYEIVEKDADAAYVLFRYPVQGQKTPASGAMEVVETEHGVKVFVQLPRLPEYHETLLRDGLLRKLRDEYGPPPVKTVPPATPTKPDKSEPSRGSEKKPKKPDADTDDEGNTDSDTDG